MQISNSISRPSVSTLRPSHSMAESKPGDQVTLGGGG